MPPDDGLRDSIERARQAFRTASDGRPPLGWREDERPAPAQPPPEPPAQEPPSAAPAPASGPHPFFRGLLDALPEPGSSWPQAERDQWLATARQIFALLYSDIDERQPTPLPQRDAQLD